jgi:hypothetical protein
VLGCLSTSYARHGGLLDLSGKLPWLPILESYNADGYSRFTSMFESVGIANSSGVVTALIVGASFIPTMLLHWKGNRWHSKNTDSLGLGGIEK